jgi:hypothetical protein
VRTRSSMSRCATDRITVRADLARYTALSTCASGPSRLTTPYARVRWVWTAIRPRRKQTLRFMVDRYSTPRAYSVTCGAACDQTDESGMTRAKGGRLGGGRARLCVDQLSSLAIMAMTRGSANSAESLLSEACRKDTACVKRAHVQSAAFVAPGACVVKERRAPCMPSRSARRR